MDLCNIRFVKQENDAKTIADIYNYYIMNTTVTFEEQTVSIDEIASFKGWASEARRLQVWPLDRCWVLAVDALAS